MNVSDLLKRVLASVFIAVGVNGLLYKESAIFYSVLTIIAIYYFIFVPENGNDDDDSEDFDDSDGDD